MSQICGESELFLPGYLAQDYTPPSWWFGDEICGEGACLPSGFCECDPGWTGRSALVSAEGIRCDVSELAVKLLWAYNLGFSAFKIWRSRRGIREKRKQHHQLVERYRKHGQPYRLWDNKGYLALLVALFVCQPGVWLVGILHIATPDQRVGQTWPVTVFFVIAKLGFYLAAHFFQPQLLSNILRGAKGSNSRKIVRPVRVWGRCNAFLATVVGLLPCVPLFFSGEGGQRGHVAQTVYAAYMAGVVLVMILYGSQAYTILQRFNGAFTSEVTKQSNQYRQLRRRVTRFQRRAYTHALVQAVLYALYLSLPFLVNKFDYFLPLSWLVFHIMTKELGVSTLAVDAESSSSTSSPVVSRPPHVLGFAMDEPEDGSTACPADSSRASFSFSEPQRPLGDP